MNLEEILASVALATEGRTELDAHIAATCHLTKSDSPDWLKRWEGQFEARHYPGSFGWAVVALQPPGSKLDAHAGNWKPQPFTTSIDAAMTAIPDGWYGRVEPRFWYEPKPHVLWTGLAIRPNWDRWNPVNLDWFDNVEVDGAHTPALAVCMAALKVRLIQSTETAGAAA